MTGMELLVSIAAQLPVVVLFVWYSDRKDKQFQAFLENQRKEYIEALDRLANRLEIHDAKTDQAVARMEERTRPRSKSSE